MEALLKKWGSKIFFTKFGSTPAKKNSDRDLPTKFGIGDLGSVGCVNRNLFQLFNIFILDNEDVIGGPLPNVGNYKNGNYKKKKDEQRKMTWKIDKKFSNVLS